MSRNCKSNVLTHATTAEYLTADQLADLLHITTRTALRWRRDGGGPAFMRCGARRLLHSRRDVDAWLASHSFPHLAAESAVRASGVAQ